MRSTTGYALLEPGTELREWAFDRRDPRPDDVVVRVTHTGVCHSDIHTIDDIGADGLPLVPGHEFTGEVVAVGAEVTGFATGDLVAVGNIVDSCGVCENCLDAEEPYCLEFPTTTYNGRDRVDGSITRGGYSHEYVVRERFVYHLPTSLDPAGVAPLMCAGITVWQPLSRYEVGPGTEVGVVGLGGLGHLAVKFAKALGARVTVFTTSPSKAADARELGADDVIVSSDADAMDAAARRFDFILDTAAGKHPITPYVRTLAMDGTICMLGIPDQYEVDAFTLLNGRRRLTSSGSGGTRDTQAMLDFAGAHGIVADVEVLPAAQVNTALDRLRANDVRWRFVLDFTA
ncbi:NAD(P)-dependent alcohol dehydrogenase [Curtobacterium sp. Leaf261]|uniref:NAD(P)-dependent alcohol dehydrogenase n=1 Tax=Curtobacterium sp. Leaf261 TaxID=1736311 RepID=UPI0006FA6009|nr:NAD(P)-dependent alcohol dehydrogenase [Curtobacterium sp. Leaf261]KQO61220.1 alcohol dehydrogenase [Curtobacterium sp. Leaf261]